MEACGWGLCFIPSIFFSASGVCTAHATRTRLGFCGVVVMEREKEKTEREKEVEKRKERGKTGRSHICLRVYVFLGTEVDSDGVA